MSCPYVVILPYSLGKHRSLQLSHSPNPPVVVVGPVLEEAFDVRMGENEKALICQSIDNSIGHGFRLYQMGAKEILEF